MNIDETIQYLEERVKANPKSLLFARLANHYLKRGRTEDAIKLCTEGVENHPSYITGNFILGKAYLAENDFEKAEAEFKKVISMDRQYLFAHKYMGDMMAKMGWENKAAIHYKDILRIDPFDETARKMLKSLNIPDESSGEIIIKPEPAAGHKIRSQEDTLIQEESDQWSDELDDLFVEENKEPEPETNLIADEEQPKPVENLETTDKDIPEVAESTEELESFFSDDEVDTIKHEISTEKPGQSYHLDLDADEAERLDHIMVTSDSEDPAKEEITPPPAMEEPSLDLNELDLNLETPSSEVEDKIDNVVSGEPENMDDFTIPDLTKDDATTDLDISIPGEEPAAPAIPKPADDETAGENIFNANAFDTLETEISESSDSLFGNITKDPPSPPQPVQENDALDDFIDKDMTQFFSGEETTKTPATPEVPEIKPIETEESGAVLDDILQPEFEDEKLTEPTEILPPMEEEEEQTIVSPTLGEIYAAQGQFTKAIKVYKTLLEKNPEEARYRQKIDELENKLNDSK